ncbi:MAG: aminopeptidase [Chloroflexota bacterium]
MTIPATTAGDPGTAGMAVTFTVGEIADRVARDYLGLRPGERFAIIVDDRTDPEIPRELARAARGLYADPVVVSFPPRARSGAEPPASAAAAMAAADVVICAASTSLYHTTAKAAAQRAGVRGDFNAPYRGDAWRTGAMTADFVAIRERAERLAALWRRTSEIRITSPAGTDLRATVAGREPMAWLTGICRNPGEVSALPGGEVSLPPVEGTSEGVVVWERVASDLGALDAPVTITIRGGRAVAIEGGASAERLRAIVAAVTDADNIGEIGIGLNPAARIADEITEAKKAFGTVHIALGDSANEYGGLVECDVHLDGLVMAPTIEFDGVAVVVSGRHVYDERP